MERGGVQDFGEWGRQAGKGQRLILRENMREFHLQKGEGEEPSMLRIGVPRGTDGLL